MYDKYRKSLFELGIVLLGGLVVFITAGWFDFFEKIVGFIHLYEAYELDEIMVVSLYLVIALLIVSVRRFILLRKLVGELESRNAQIQDAAREIKGLRNILPICMHCKKIRNEDDKWERLESYISNRTDSRFSHGICPDCAEIHYPEEVGPL